MRAWQVAVSMGGLYPTCFYFTDKERAKRTARGMSLASGMPVSFNRVDVSRFRKVYKGASLQRVTR